MNPFRVRRVITTRVGGVSRPPFDTFNLGDHVGDDVNAVADNRHRLADVLDIPPSRIVWMEQLHTATVQFIDGPRREPVEACDALVTDVPDMALVVLTADCVPVLLADDTVGVIAAVHAGRVGARNGIVAATVRVMQEHGAQLSDISALLGPAASGRRYEVPRSMQEDVERRLPGSACRTLQGTTGLDIRAGVARQLHDLGVGKVDIDPRCTIEDERLFSHRRQAPTGRMASVIWLDTRERSAI